MKLREFSLLSDENIDSAVVTFLRRQGLDVVDVCEQGWRGMADADLLGRAVAQSRLILTHDSDFGTLAVRLGQPVIGIVYLRPGHIDADFTIATLQAVFDAQIEVQPPFLLVARRSGIDVHIRVRQLT